MKDKHTLVIGASTDPEKYSNKAVRSLQQNHITVYAVGIKEGDINGTPIMTNRPRLENIHTISLYLSPKNQGDWKEYIYSLHPKRILFNPGTENPEFMEEASKKGIECIAACNLVMLSVGNF